MGRSVSGTTNTVLVGNATKVNELFPGLVLTSIKGILYLESVTVFNSHATDPATIQLWDQLPAVAVAANEKYAFSVPALTSFTQTFPGKGLQFNVDVCLSSTAGTVAAYEATGCANIEGGL